MNRLIKHELSLCLASCSTRLFIPTLSHSRSCRILLWSFILTYRILLCDYSIIYFSILMLVVIWIILTFGDQESWRTLSTHLLNICQLLFDISNVNLSCLGSVASQSIQRHAHLLILYQLLALRRSELWQGHAQQHTGDSSCFAGCYTKVRKFQKIVWQ